MYFYFHLGERAIEMEIEKGIEEGREVGKEIMRERERGNWRQRPEGGTGRVMVRY